MYDPNDPGVILSKEEYQRLQKGILRTETDSFNHETPFPRNSRRGGVEKLRMIRGRCAASVTQSTLVLYLDNVIPLCGGLDPSNADPTTLVPVANSIFPRAIPTGAWVDAVYSPNLGIPIPATGTGTSYVAPGTAIVQWETLDVGTSTGSVGTGAMRRFELAFDKFSWDQAASVYWLDHNETIIPEFDIVYDPEMLFTGKAANYISGIQGFRGVAVLRGDVGTGTGTGTSVGTSERWEIIEMEGFARWITATYKNTGTGTGTSGPFNYIYDGFYNVIDNYQRKPPVADLGALTVNTSEDMVQSIVGDHTLLMLIDADGNQFVPTPIYLPVCVLDRTVIVQVRSASGGDPAGHPVASSLGLFPGKSGFTCNSPPVDSDVTLDCWITDLSGHTKLANKAFYLGRFIGLTTGTGGSNLPNFAISAHLRAVIGAVNTVVQTTDATFTISSLSVLHGAMPPAPLTVEQTFPVGYALGQVMWAVETEDGHWINTPDSGKVRCSGTDGLPEFLYDSIIDHETFNGSTHQIVYAEEQAALPAGNTRIKLFTATGTNTGTDFDIKQPTSIDLNIVGNSLRVTLNYLIYRVRVIAAVSTGTGSFSGNVDVGTCGTGT